ncbi:hypothetical protein ACFQZ0_32435 [Streptomyces erythrogriseus]
MAAHEELQPCGRQGGEGGIPLARQYRQARARAFLDGRGRQVPRSTGRIENGEFLVDFLTGPADAGVERDARHQRGERRRRGAQLTYVRLEPPLQQELERLPHTLLPSQLRCLGCQLLRLGGEFRARSTCPGRVHAVGHLGDGQPRLVPAAQRLEPGPQKLAPADGVELAVLPQPPLDLRQ